MYNILSKKASRLLSTVLCFVLLSGFAAIPEVSAAVTYYMNDNFESSALPGDIVIAPATGASIGLSVNASGKALEFGGSPVTSGAESTVTKTLASRWVPVSGKKYIFELDFYTDRGTDQRYLFNYPVNSSYTDLYSLFDIRGISGGGNYVYMYYPKTSILIGSEEASRLAINKWYKLLVVVDGSLTRVSKLYVNGVEPAGVDYSKFPNNISSTTGASKLRFIQKASGTTRTALDNIRIYEAGPIEVIGTNAGNGFVPIQRSINTDFSNIIDTANPGTVGVYRGTQLIPSENKVKANSIGVHLLEDLLPNTSYTLKIEGVKDVGGNMAASKEIQFATSDVSYYLNDMFEDDNSLGKYTSVLAGGGSVGVNTPDAGSGNHAVVMTVPEVASGSTVNSFSRYIPNVPLEFDEGDTYIFSMKFKTDSYENISRLFQYGSGDNENLITVQKLKNDGDEAYGLGFYFPDNTAAKIGTAKFQQDTWTEVTAAVYGETKNYDIFLNGSKVNGSPLTMTNTPSVIESVGFQYKASAGSARRNCYDDIAVTKLSDFKHVNVSMDPEKKFEIYTKKIRLTFNQYVDPSTVSAIKIRSQDDESDEADITSQLDETDKRTVIIQMNEALHANTNYRIDLEGLRGALTPEEKAEDLELCTDNQYNMTEPVITNALGAVLKDTLTTGRITAKAYVDNHGYTGDERSASLVMAYYYEDQLMDIVSHTVDRVTDQPQEMTVALNIENAGEGYYIKVFSMHNLEDLMPIRQCRLVGY